MTLQTDTVLPNMPGSVTKPIAGRTYPLEGTAVLMPQHAPYTDPVTILICGGSDSDIALDNCVSIQPEVEKPEWTIERMVKPVPRRFALSHDIIVALGAGHDVHRKCSSTSISNLLLIGFTGWYVPFSGLPCDIL